MRYVLDTSVAIKTVISEADSAKAIQLRDDYNNAVHDLIALAEREGCELVTADDRLAKAVGPTLPFVISLANLP